MRLAHRMRARLLARTRSAARGSASAFVVGMVIVLFACAGLVLDGGTALNARMKLADDLENASRAGAQMIDVVNLQENGVLTINASAAQQRAADHLAGLGYEAINVVVNDNTVTVSARDTIDTALLSLIGIGDFDISATASATAEIP